MITFFKQISSNDHSEIRKTVTALSLAVSLLLSLSALAQDLTVSVNPADRGQQVIFGGDGKLTIKDWAEKSVGNTSQKLFGEMALEILRIPIFALQPIEDTIYDNVITVVNAVKSVNPNVKIFASIANGDGYGKDHHGADKFPSSMRGCCSYNVYSLNLTAYANYIDKFINRMAEAGISIDYLGPWNEDPADDSDHRKVFDQMNNLGNTKRVGLERWGLLTSIADVDDVEDRVDIIGSHFYDDERIGDRDAAWKNLVDKSADPVWYTESTRYSTQDNMNLLIAGMENIFPGIRAGVESVIFYQVVKRFVYANGSALPIKYSGFKNLVNNSQNKNVVPSNSNDVLVKTVGFSDGNTLSLHFTNTHGTSKRTKILLENGYSANGTVTRTIWDANNTEVSNAYRLGGNTSWNITLPANSYVHLEVPLSQ